MLMLISKFYNYGEAPAGQIKSQQEKKQNKVNIIST